MEDDFAETLYAAYRSAGPSWAALSLSERAGWRAVALAARAAVDKESAAEIEMLRAANEAWQRENAALDAVARRLVRQEVLDTLSGLVAEFGAERAVAMLEETLFGTREEPS